jgi:hypothetical protein
MLSARTLPQVLRQLSYWSGVRAVQALSVAYWVVGEGVMYRTTPSSTAQKPFTPVEFNVLGIAEAVNWVFAELMGVRPLEAN